MCCGWVAVAAWRRQTVRWHCRAPHRPSLAVWESVLVAVAPNLSAGRHTGERLTGGTGDAMRSPSRLQARFGQSHPDQPQAGLVRGGVTREMAVSPKIGLVSDIRPCRDDERHAILAIVNSAAEAYRGVIPADRWHEPYMPPGQLEREIAAGVAFWGYEAGGELAGIMGIQPVRDVDLIRHAYVSPGGQRRGVGSALLEHLRGLSMRRMLVGTWAAADWAISFYEHHGFKLVSPQSKTALLKTYWRIPDRQIETSVVLASPPLHETASVWAPR